MAMRTLFVCTGNTCRSPMAERLGRFIYPWASWESAGVRPQDTMHPMTAAVLVELGADPDGFASRDVATLDLSVFDHVVLIGEAARKHTPDPPEGVEVHYWNVPDPYEVTGTEVQILAVYRECAQDLKQRISNLAMR